MDPFEEYEARVRGRQLADLRWHWGEAYRITLEAGVFRAVRRDTGRELTARCIGELGRHIKDDYSAKPVPRSAWG